MKKITLLFCFLFLSVGFCFSQSEVDSIISITSVEAILKRKVTNPINTTSSGEKYTVVRACQNFSKNYLHILRYKNKKIEFLLNTELGRDLMTFFNEHANNNKTSIIFIKREEAIDLYGKKGQNGVVILKNNSKKFYKAITEFLEGKQYL